MSNALLWETAAGKQFFLGHNEMKMDFSPFPLRVYNCGRFRERDSQSLTLTDEGRTTVCHLFYFILFYVWYIEAKYSTSNHRPPTWYHHQGQLLVD